MPRCKNCRNKFEPIRFNQKYCLESECVKVWVAEEKSRQWKKTKKDFNESDIKYWIKKAKEACHAYIRLRDKDKGCISCGKPLVNGNTDAGHMWSSHSSSYLRYHEFNINGQCSRPCNKDLSGDPNNYRMNFVKRYSKELLEELDSLSHLEKRYTIEDLKEITMAYKQKIKELCKN